MPLLQDLAPVDPGLEGVNLPQQHMCGRNPNPLYEVHFIQIEKSSLGCHRRERAAPRVKNGCPENTKLSGVMSAWSLFTTLLVNPGNDTSRNAFSSLFTSFVFVYVDADA